MIGDIFWKDGFTGEGGQGGFFVRNDLPTFLTKLEAQNMEVVGIKIDERLQLEIIVKEVKE